MHRFSFLLAAVAASGTAFSERDVTLAVATKDIAEFRRAAELAKDLGANRLWACQVEPSIWQWNADRRDPYPNWGMRNATVFKFVVPEALRPYLPADYAARNLATLKARAKILGESGLKASFTGMEPAWLPEKAYRDHPSWRGPRCDQARRARGEYYAPCLDDPEVRAMYVEAVAELCRACPFDKFSLLTNDSGGGLCWSEGLYPGRNGPAACKDVPQGERISRFLSVFQEGARAAGLGEIAANVRNIYEGDEARALPALKAGQSVNGRGPGGESLAVSVGLAGDYIDHTFPVWLLPRMVYYAESAQAAQARPEADLAFLFRSLDDIEAVAFVKKWFGRMEPGPAGRYAALTDIAADFVGAANAPRLVEIWNLVEKATLRHDHFETGGHVFQLGTVHQRWLTRPFVAFPEELTADEKGYYREFQFQAQEESDADNMLDLQAHRWLAGYGGQFLFFRTMQYAIQDVGQAIRLCDALADDLAAEKSGYAPRARLLSKKLRMYRCLMRNADHAVSFQNILDRADRSKAPADASLDIWEQGDVQLVKINQLVRDEIDNTLEVVGLLESTPEPLLWQAPEKSLESVMIFGPDLVRQLRRKVETMENHRRDFLRLYRSYNR